MMNCRRRRSVAIEEHIRTNTKRMMMTTILDLAKRFDRWHCNRYDATTSVVDLKFYCCTRLVIFKLYLNLIKILWKLVKH